MCNLDSNIETNLKKLQQQLAALIQFYKQDLDYQQMVYEFWNAKDILGHLTFWHESFARNIADLGEGRKPNPLKGKLSEVNKQSVETMASSSIETLIDRLKKAQTIIEQYIYNTAIGIIPYKKGSRGYSRQEHLEIVAAHIKRHLKDLNKRYS
ncbi:hypothetical protein [uncultured Microscilla sp.]|uniref:hypothetical protein n=1 Tax=uncultured Microscilla sp. TaxID=432653 RepID=UPI002602D254|nr:hypothetical protein [uncultured Microscilla sp.]